MGTYHPYGIKKSYINDFFLFILTFWKKLYTIFSSTNAVLEQHTNWRDRMIVSHTVRTGQGGDIVMKDGKAHLHNARKGAGGRIEVPVHVEGENRVRYVTLGAIRNKGAKGIRVARKAAGVRR